jgi:hypothetical protein
MQFIGPSCRLASQLDGGFPTLIRNDFDFTPTHSIAMLNTGTKGFAHCLLRGKPCGELMDASAAVCQFTLGVDAREKSHPVPRVGGLDAFDFNQINSNSKHLATFEVIIPQQCEMSKIKDEGGRTIGLASPQGNCPSAFLRGHFISRLEL